MQESPQEYMNRIMQSLDGKQPMDILAATPQKLAELARGRGLLILP